MALQTPHMAGCARAIRRQPCITRIARITGITRPRCFTPPAPAAAASRRHYSAAAASEAAAPSHSPKWRPISVLDDWVARAGRPLSVRQLMHFGRSLTEARLLSSANYVRTELPTRLAHRIRDMQQLPYAVVRNTHIHDVYELYYSAFDTFRKVKEIRSLDDNDAFCKVIGHTLQAHLPVIPKLAMGILESGDLMSARDLDLFANTLLSARISRRVIAEQHLALTETYNSSWYSPGASLRGPDHDQDHDQEFIGEVFLKCRASDVVERCGRAVCALARSAYGVAADDLPAIELRGDLKTTFPYILSHLEYIIGELLRNAVQAVVERHLAGDRRDRRDRGGGGGGAVRARPPPIEVTLCETQQDVIIRVSDQGGGVQQDMLPYLWSFSKGEHSQRLLQNLKKVPRISATLQELREGDEAPPASATHASHASHASHAAHRQESYPLGPERHSQLAPPGSCGSDGRPHHAHDHDHDHGNSLASLSQRPPNLRLGMGLPLSRVYAEYWAGSLELHSLDGYGVDAFLQISKLGNKNERLIMRARMDCV